MWRKCKEAPVRSVPDGLACCATRPHARAAATENRDASSFGDQILTRRPHVTYRTKIAASTQGLTATLDNILSLFVILDMPATGMPTTGKKMANLRTMPPHVRNLKIESEPPDPRAYCSAHLKPVPPRQRPGWQKMHHRATLRNPGTLRIAETCALHPTAPSSCHAILPFFQKSSNTRLCILALGEPGRARDHIADRGHSTPDWLQKSK